MWIILTVSQPKSPNFGQDFFLSSWTDFHFLPMTIPKSSAMIWNKIFARVLDLVSFQKKYWKNKTDTRPILPNNQARNWIISLLNSRNIPWTTAMDVERLRSSAMKSNGENLMNFTWWYFKKYTNKVKSAKSSTTTKIMDWNFSSFFVRWRVRTDFLVLMGLC